VQGEGRKEPERHKVTKVILQIGGREETVSQNSPPKSVAETASKRNKDGIKERERKNVYEGHAENSVDGEKG